MTSLRRFARLFFLVCATALAWPAVWACPTDTAHVGTPTALHQADVGLAAASAVHAQGAAHSQSQLPCADCAACTSHCQPALAHSAATLAIAGGTTFGTRATRPVSPMVMAPELPPPRE